MTDPQPVIGQWDVGFHTMRGDFHSEGHRFRPWVVGVVDVWGGFGTKDVDLSFSGAARSRGYP